MLAGRSLKYYMKKQKIDDILTVNNLRVNYNTVPKVPLVTSGLIKISGGLIKFDF